MISQAIGTILAIGGNYGGIVKTISQAKIGRHKNKFSASSLPSQSALNLEAKIRAEEMHITLEQHEARYQAAVCYNELGLDNPLDRPYSPPGDGIIHPKIAASHARTHLTSLESTFLQEARQKWPSVTWRRYAMVTIPVIEGHPSVWYAPFLHTKKRLIVILDDRPDFPYRIYGQNRALYERHGYTILDFSEDFSVPWNQSVWNEAMGMVDRHLRGGAA